MQALVHFFYISYFKLLVFIFLNTCVGFFFYYRSLSSFIIFFLYAIVLWHDCYWI